VDVVVSSSNAPNASPPKYNDTLYEKGRLVSVWGGENLTVKVQGLEGIDLPADSLVWNVEGFDVPNNSLEYTFWWPSPRTPLIEIDLFGEEISKIYVDVPSVGSITENDALVQLAGTNPLAAVDIVGHGIEARDFVQSNIPPGGNRRADAFRHAYWNALCVSSPVISVSETLFVTTTHEYKNKWDDPHVQEAFNSTMDLRNNLVGTTAYHPSLISTEENRAIIRSDIFGKYDNGELWIWDFPQDFTDNNGAHTDSNGMLLKSDGTTIY
jgi:hypothetical protein